MAENTKTTEPVKDDVVKEKKTPIRNFIHKHPTAAKVIGIAVLAAGALGVGVAVGSRSGDDSSDDANLNELTASEFDPSTETYTVVTETV
jgi:hypothetical protein